MTLADVEAFLKAASPDERKAVLQLLRQKFGLAIHPLEEKWQISAEAILEAIDQSGDLTQRGVRGVLAEAIFRTVVVPRRLRRWTDKPPIGDVAYDLCLSDGSYDPPVRVQVKLQRRLKGQPMLYQGAAGVYVVETQRTRTGKKRGKGSGGSDIIAGVMEPEGKKRQESQATRPYRIDEFDLLAVCMQPSTGDWQNFVYCATRDLLRRASDPQLLEVLQPIRIAAGNANAETPFTRDFEDAVRRVRTAR